MNSEAVNDIEASNGKAKLTLPETRVEVHSSTLQRKNEDGSVLFELPLSSILSADFRRPFDPFCFLFIGTALAIAGIGRFASELNWLSCLLYLAAVVTMAIGFAGCRKDQLQLQTKNGEVLINCDELENEVRSFTTALNAILAA